jgi:hypothetical protein
VTFQYRWLLNRGVHMGRFDCICESQKCIPEILLRLPLNTNQSINLPGIIPWYLMVRHQPYSNHRGSQLYFHITRYVLKEGRTLFLLPKVKVEFRHLFSLQKQFSLCSSHKINANIVVFCWLTGLQWNNTRF